MSSTSTSSNDAFADFKLWYYTPNIAAAIIFTIIFVVLICLHTYRLIQSRTWFCIPFVVGALFEAIGYVCRIIAHSNTTAVAPYAIQSVLILVAPALFAASIYMILGRIIMATHAEQLSVIRINWLTKIFVCGDVFCFLIQTAGSGLMASAKTKADVNRSEDINLGGLILQIVVFLVFIAVAGVFHSRLRRNPTARSQDTDLPWERYMLLLYTVSVLIAVRNIVRVIEYAGGSTSYLLTHEWTLYVFDAFLMATTLAICLVWYVPSIQPRPRKAMESYETQPMEQLGDRAKHTPV